MTYFHAELVQIIVSGSDSELEVQRYGMKKNTLTVDPIMLQDELWIRQRERSSPNYHSGFFENQTAETVFSFFFNFEVGSVFRKSISHIFVEFCTPLSVNCPCTQLPTQLAHFDTAEPQLHEGIRQLVSDAFKNRDKIKYLVEI